MGNEETRWRRSFRAPRGVQLPPRLGARKAFRDQPAKPRVKAFGGDRAGRRRVNNIGDLGRLAYKVKRLVADQLAKPLVKAFGGDQPLPMCHDRRHLRGFAPRANGYRGDRLGRPHGFGDFKGFGGGQAGRRHMNNIGDLGRFAHKVRRLGADQLGKPRGFIRELGGRVAPRNYGVDEAVIRHGHAVERGFAHKAKILVVDRSDREPARPPAHGMVVDVIIKIKIRFEKSFRIA